MVAASATINTIGIRHRLNLLTVRMIPSQPVTDPRNRPPTDTQLGVKPFRAQSAITTSTQCRSRVSTWKTRFSRVACTLRLISVGFSPPGSYVFDNSARRCCLLSYFQLGGYCFGINYRSLMIELSELCEYTAFHRDRCTYDQSRESCRRCNHFPMDHEPNRCRQKDGKGNEDP